MPIADYPHPHRVTPIEGVEGVLTVNAEDIVKESLTSMLGMLGPRIFNDDLPNTFTIATTGHVALGAFSIVPPFEDLSGLTEWLDSVMSECGGEPPLAINLCIPMASDVVLHAWDAAGRTAYTHVLPGPFPGTIAVSILHDHMPPPAEDPEGSHLLEELVAVTGKHLWGPAWALLPQTGELC